MKAIKTAIITAAIVCFSLVSGTALSGVYTYDEKEFSTWLNEIKKMAAQKGITKKTYDRALKDIKPIPRIVALDRKQPESTITFEQYLKRVVPESRIKKGRDFLEKHKKLLKKIAQKYRVQPRFIVALWGIESDFGERMGGFYVPEALATLAFEGRRRSFFTRELLHALSIIDEGHIDAENMKGSWAGAMGQSQFMPSSFITYAQDFNGDGSKDIWGSREDVFASIANYLASVGWDDSTTWGRRVQLPEGFDYSLGGKDKSKYLREWQKIGVRREDGSSLPVREGLKASLIFPGGDDGAAYLVYPNYKTLLNWNRSLYFATSVGHLSDAVGR